MKVLVIDDDYASAEILEMMLAPSHAVTRHAFNGEHGVIYAKEFCPDVILLDYMLPGIDGLYTTRELRKISTAPILILSVLDDPAILSKVLNEGADDYLIRPVSREVLLAHINNLVRRYDHSKPEKSVINYSFQST